jgi:hypothetical protein
MLGDVMKFCNSLVQRLDLARAAKAIRHTWTVFKLLVDTDLASRATR